MAMSLVQTWTNKTDSRSKFMEFYFEDNEGRTYWWSYYIQPGAGKQKLWVEKVPRTQTLVEDSEEEFWTIEERTWNWG